MSPPVHRRRAHAKVNLALSVGPAIAPGLPDAGYHPIASWVHAIDLSDEVAIRPLAPGERSRFSVAWAPDAPRPGPIDWLIERDLAFRAHAALERATGRALPVEASVTKRIPVGGGLGGGSSDAGAMLLLLDAAFGLGLGAPRLAPIALALGSDVPFFLAPPPPPPAIVTGLGGTLERTPRRPGDLVLILPPFGCPTGAVYRAFDAAPAALNEDRVRSAARAGLGPAHLFNDLAPAAERVEPRLAALRARIARLTGLPVHMSGSGSTLFLAPDATSPDPAPRLREELADAAVLRARLV